MSRIQILGVLVALAMVSVLTNNALAEKKAVTLEKEWKGYVDDEALAKDTPAVIVDAKALEKLWKAWRIEGKVPDVDFKKQLVILMTISGSKLRLSATLDDKGNLGVLGLGTRDLRPGFRYVIATVSREGIKTVYGRKLPNA
jgi:hypothetical protein